MMTKAFVLGMFMSLFFVNFSNGQENNEVKVGSLQGTVNTNNTEVRESNTATVNAPAGTAILAKEIQGEDIRYTFISSRVFDETTKERWEYRFPISFDYIKNFSMDVVTQQVEIILPETHTEEELKKLITRFGYENFEIN